MSGEHWIETEAQKARCWGIKSIYRSEAKMHMHKSLNEDNLLFPCVSHFLLIDSSSARTFHLNEPT